MACSRSEVSCGQGRDYSTSSYYVCHTLSASGTLITCSQSCGPSSCLGLLGSTSGSLYHRKLAACHVTYHVGWGILLSVNHAVSRTERSLSNNALSSFIVGGLRHSNLSFTFLVGVGRSSTGFTTYIFALLAELLDSECFYRLTDKFPCEIKMIT